MAKKKKKEMSAQTKSNLSFVGGVVLFLIVFLIIILVTFGPNNVYVNKATKEEEAHRQAASEWDNAGEADFGSLDNVVEYTHKKPEETTTAMSVVDDVSTPLDAYGSQVVDEINKSYENDLPIDDEMKNVDQDVIPLDAYDYCQLVYNGHIVKIPLSGVTFNEDGNELTYTSEDSQYSIRIDQIDIEQLNIAIEDKCKEIDPNYSKEVISSIHNVYSKVPNEFTCFTCNYTGTNGSNYQLKYLTSSTSTGLTYFASVQNTNSQVTSDILYPVLEYAAIS